MAQSKGNMVSIMGLCVIIAATAMLCATAMVAIVYRAGFEGNVQPDGTTSIKTAPTAQHGR